MSDFDVILGQMQQQNIEQDRRLKNLERSTETLSELTFITKDLVEAVKNMTEIQKAHSNRLEALERAPGERLLSLKNTAALAAVSAITGGLATLGLQALL